MLQTLVFGLDRRAEDDTLAEALGMVLVAVGHHTEVVGAADAEVEVVFGPPRPPQEGPQERRPSS